MAEQEQNRNEAATPHKLDEARKKGSVPKSLDLNSLMAMSAVTAAFYFWGRHIINGELGLFKNVFTNTYQVSFEITDLASLLSRLLAEGLALLTPFFLLLVVLGVVANFMQTGPIFSFFPLKPDIERVNPISGFKRIFSAKLLIEAIKTVLKFAVLTVVAYYAISSFLPKLITSFQVSPVSIGTILFPGIVSLLLKLLLAFALVAAIDLMYSRWDFGKRMRMSRREITEEHKRREGDPRIKSRLRELQREAVKRARSLGKVKDADVLITNPTHFAVAIKYDRKKMDAPLVVAKGAGFLAGKMRAIARQHRVPIVENRFLARSLFHQVEIERAVPMEHYSTIARILLWAYSLKGVSAKSALA